MNIFQRMFELLDIARACSEKYDHKGYNEAMHEFEKLEKTARKEIEAGAKELGWM